MSITSFDASASTLTPEVWERLTPEVRERWEHLSADDRNAVLASARALSRPVADVLKAPATAPVDHATMVELDRLVEAQQHHANNGVRITRIEARTACSDTEHDCPNKIARTMTTIAVDGSCESEIVELDCERRSCPVCGPVWAGTWAMNVHHNFADARAVAVLTIADGSWGTLHKAISRNKTDDDRYVRIPAGEGRSLVITSTPIPQAASMAANAAILVAERALLEVHKHASVDERRVSSSRNFDKPAQVRRAPGLADPDVIYGQFPKVSADVMALAAERAGCEFVTVVRGGGDPDDAGRFRLRGSALAVQLALSRLGHRTDAELEAGRAERRWERAFVERERAAQRRRSVLRAA